MSMSISSVLPSPISSDRIPPRVVGGRISRTSPALHEFQTQIAVRYCAANERGGGLNSKEV